MKLEVSGIALAALTLAACSTQPTQTAARQAATPAPPPAAAPAPSSSAAEGVPVAVGPDGKQFKLNRSLVAAGYKATDVDGQIYYCRQEAVIGTGFKKKICLNEAQMRDQEQRTKTMQDRMLNTEASPGCMGPTCTGP